MLIRDRFLNVYVSKKFLFFILLFGFKLITVLFCLILNILKNAKDALVENNIKSPYIKIEAKVDEKNIYLSITDNAGGIKTKPINKIFEAYFTTKPQSQGTGIGLYMSKMILEKSMKGKLFVENIEDKARFTIKL